jgi:hypothetical protein
MDTPEYGFISAKDPSGQRYEDARGAESASSKALSVDALMKEFVASQCCTIEASLPWSPPIILRNLSFLPKEGNIERLKRLLEKTNGYVRLLESSPIESNIDGIMARAQALRMFPDFMEALHQRFSEHTQIYATLARNPLAAKGARGSLNFGRLKGAWIHNDREPLLLAVEQRDKEWSKKIIQQKLNFLLEATYEETQELSIEAIDQISSIWAKQEKQIELYEREQLRLCSLTLLRLLQIHILDRIKEIVAVAAGEGSCSLVTLYTPSEAATQKAGDFQYALCGIESASEQDSCSSSSEGLSRPLKGNFQSCAWDSSGSRWSQSVVLRLIFEIPMEVRFNRLEKVLQISDTYEHSLSMRIRPVDMYEIKRLGEKLCALLELVGDIYVRLYPQADEHMSLEVNVDSAKPLEKQHLLSGWRHFMTSLGFKKESKTLSEESSFSWTLDEIKQKKLMVQQAHMEVVELLARQAQDQVCTLWAMHYKAIRQMEKEQYQVSNVALLKALKFAVMEQIKTTSCSSADAL